MLRSMFHILWQFIDIDNLVTRLGKAFHILTLSVLTTGNASDRQQLFISADEDEL